MKTEQYGNLQSTTTILCIPGLFLSGDCFQELISQIPDYHWICVTLDGHHPKSDDFPSLNEEVSRLTKMLLDHNLTDIDLCIGLSLGTIISVCLAKSPQIHIHQLLLDGAVNFYSSPSKLLEQKAMYRLFQMGIKMYQNNHGSFFQVRPGGPDPWADIYAMCMNAMTDASLRSIIQTLSEFTPESGLNIPMHCLYGSKETNLQINKKVISKCFPQAEFHIHNGCNHLGFLNQEPKAYAAFVKNLISNKENP